MILDGSTHNLSVYCNESDAIGKRYIEYRRRMMQIQLDADRSCIGRIVGERQNRVPIGTDVQTKNHQTIHF